MKINLSFTPKPPLVLFLFNARWKPNLWRTSGLTAQALVWDSVFSGAFSSAKVRCVWENLALTAHPCQLKLLAVRRAHWHQLGPTYPIFISQSFLGVRDCRIAVSMWGCSLLSVVTTGKGLTLNCGERNLIIPHLCPAAGGGKVEMKLLTVSQLAPPCVCIHLCLISFSGTISPGS